MNRVFFQGGKIAFVGRENVKNIQKTNKPCYCLGGNSPPPPKGPEKTLTVKDKFPDSLVPRPPLQRGAWVEGGSWYEMILLIDQRPARPCSQHRLQWIIKAIVTRSNHAVWSSSGLALARSTTFWTFCCGFVTASFTNRDMLCCASQRCCVRGWGSTANFCFHSNVAGL